MRDLSDIRMDIDLVDRQIVKLFEERMKLTAQVAEYKIAAKKPVYDKTREEEKLKTLSELTVLEENKAAVRELFTCIMAISRGQQSGFMEKLSLKE
ncbi:chorismate mutase [uncultured Roseburia sp.]|uniref:Chorismate mutase n=1 Tax=Brotonthovivens ammoniilytica TaxID=2981725 RepID=A0ABT2TGR9_9FIRM|nr:chorismate mutase [Brotonthovivens ammoniilytica]MCU6761368.1 chorismate mutase [Brotonthovivens ammoniilytica]SCI26467.1 chorismate mutase [uncultured Roseburia sp.]